MDCWDWILDLTEEESLVLGNARVQKESYEIKHNH